MSLASRSLRLGAAVAALVAVSWVACGSDPGSSPSTGGGDAGGAAGSGGAGAGGTSPGDAGGGGAGSGGSATTDGGVEWGAAPLWEATGQVAAGCPIERMVNAKDVKALAWEPCSWSADCEEAVFNPALLGTDADFTPGSSLDDDGVSVRIGLALESSKHSVVFASSDGSALDGIRGTLGPTECVYKGFRVRNLLTGKLSYLGGGACYSLCATEDAFVCESGKIYVVNPETGTQQKIDGGTELQWAGACSPDRKQYAWIDYRDPPGPGSTPFFARSGGEIYVHDFGTKTTKRVTFDSPNQPRAKAYPAVGDGLAVWNEPPLGAADPNPSEYGPYQSACTALATLDLKTGQRCQLSSPRPLAWKSLHGRHVYAAWIDKAKNEIRLVDIDLDSPEVQWTCQMTPGWGQ